MTKVFPPQYYGSMFHVTVHKAEGKTKDGQKAHIYTSKDNLIIVSSDWKTNIATIPPTAIVDVEAKGDADVLIKTKVESKQVYYYIEAIKNSKILAAIKPETEKTTKTVVYKSETTVVPTYNDMINMQTFIDLSTKNANQFFSPFPNKTIPSSFIDLYICMYRLRFNNVNGVNTEKCFPITLTAFRRELLFNWYIALIRACKFKVEPNAFEYFVRIIINTSADIAQISESLQMPCTELLSSIAEMSENGSAESIISVAEQSRSRVSMQIEQSYKEMPAPAQALSDLIMKVALVGFCGIQVNIFSVDLERLTTTAIDYTMACHSKNCNEDNIKSLKKSLDLFTNELLRFMDAKRYDPEFHFVFIAFTIVEEIKRMKFDFN